MTVASFLDRVPGIRKDTEAQPGNVVPITPTSDAEGSRRYALTALRDECDKVAALAEGERNHGLNKAAFKLGQHIGAENLTVEEVNEALTQAALQCGLSLPEIRATLRIDKGTSAFTAGSRSPRVAPEMTGTSTVSDVPAATLRAEPTSPETADDTSLQRPERTSWWPNPIIEEAERAAIEPEPQFLARDDGQCLTYAGKVNGLIGESESGKSWVALLAVHQALQQGHKVLFLDFEDSPATIKTRLDLMGADRLDQLDYAHPDQALDVLASEDLNEAIGLGHQLVVVDGVNAAMALLGYDLNSNIDATLFNRKVLTPLTRNGAAVLTVDHVPKNADNRMKGGIGAQAKRAMMDGACLVVEVDKPFGRGLDGELKLWVDKDRTGHVRGAAGGGKFAGRAHLKSHDDQVEMWIEAPDDEAAGGGSSWQPTYLMEQVSKLLADMPDGLSKRAIEDEVNGRRDSIRHALDELVSGGWVERRQREGRGGGILHVLLTPYSEGDKPQDRTSPEPRPNLARANLNGTSPQPLQSRAGGARFEQPAGQEDRPAEQGEVPICEKCLAPTPTNTHQATGGYCADCADILGIYNPFRSNR